MPTRDELTTTYQQLRDELLAERTAQGYWEGELATSAVSTATAVSALSLATRAAIDSGTFVAEIPAWTSLATRGSDGLVIMPDGTKYISSVFKGGVSRLRPGGAAEQIASSIPTAASMCYDAAARQLVIPLNEQNGLAFLKLP